MRSIVARSTLTEISAWKAAFAQQTEAEWAEHIGAQRVEQVREALHILLTKVLAEQGEQ